MRHCATCTCGPLMTDEEFDILDAAEKDGTEEGHQHCPDCGCNPVNHTEHAKGCRRIGQARELQCGPPWNPWPEAS